MRNYFNSRLGTFISEVKKYLGGVPDTIKGSMTHDEELESVFLEKVWEALKGDHNDLRKEQIILRAFRDATNSRIQEFVREVRDALYAKRTRANIADDESDDWYIDSQDVADVFEALSQKYISKEDLTK